MNEILLIFLSAGVGIIATLLTQVIARRIRLSDVRRRQSLKNLKDIKLWIESYRLLFKCQYPMLASEIVSLCDGKTSRDNTAATRVHKALKQYQEANNKCIEAERIGRIALESFSKVRWWDNSLKNLFEFLVIRFRLSFQKSLSLMDTLDRFDSKWRLPIQYRRGLPNKIYTGLEIINKQKFILFDHFPTSYFYIEWDKLDFVEPENVNQILFSVGLTNQWPGSLEQRYEWKSWGVPIKDDMPDVQAKALETVDSILSEIRAYETKILHETDISSES